MRGDVSALSHNVQYMSRSVGGMGVDIHRGASSFTSPWNFMQNMVSPRSGTQP
jgi:hypothetical protein